MTLLLDQPPYQKTKHYIVGDLNNATIVQNRGFFIPCYPMGIEQEEYYINILSEFLEKY